jgi:hypothetical protein
MAGDLPSGKLPIFPDGAMDMDRNPLWLAYGLFVTAFVATAGWAAFLGWTLWRAVSWTLT